MGLAWWIFQIFINLFESAAICYFIQKHFPGKFSQRTNYFFNVGAVLVNSTIYTLYYLWVPPRIMDSAGFLLFWVIYSLLFRKGLWYEKCFWSILLASVTFAISFSAIIWVMFIGNIPFIEITFWQGIPRAVLVATVKTFHVLAYIYFSKYYISSQAMKKSMYLYFISILLVCIIAITMMSSIAASLNENLVAMSYLSLSSVCILIFLMIVFYLFHNLSNQSDLLLKTQGELQHKVLMEHHNAELIKIHSNMNAWRHDFHNHIQSLLMLSESESKEDMRSYVKRLGHELEEVEGVCYTGQQALDAIVSVKYALAKTDNITVNLHIAPIKLLPISDIDLTSLFGNLFDNAIESCQRIDIEKRSIDLFLGMMENMICIRMLNATDGNDRIENDKFLTTKANSQFHGLGLASVDRIVEKANGLVERKHEDKVFTTILLIPTNSK